MFISVTLSTALYRPRLTVFKNSNGKFMAQINLGPLHISVGVNVISASAGTFDVGPSDYAYFNSWAIPRDKPQPDPGYWYVSNGGSTDE
mgnify:CR=1 FL=1|tara:strand:- start:22 stop:288 length:267 start_codon:yes stop_codon:yes gene_type:complete